MITHGYGRDVNMIFSVISKSFHARLTDGILCSLPETWFKAENQKNSTSFVWNLRPYGKSSKRLDAHLNYALFPVITTYCGRWPKLRPRKRCRSYGQLTRNCVVSFGKIPLANTGY